MRVNGAVFDMSHAATLFGAFKLVCSLAGLERTREIGMLRAVGATQRQVRRIVLIEGLLLSGLGTAFGVFGGLYLGYVMVQALSAGGFSVEYSFPLTGLLVAVADFGAHEADAGDGKIFHAEVVAQRAASLRANGKAAGAGGNREWPWPFSWAGTGCWG